MEKQLKISEFRKRFYTETLIKEDLKQVIVSKKDTVKLNEFTRQCGGTFITINGDDYNSLKQSGDLKGYLDKKSWDFVKSKPDEPLLVDVLEIRRGSELWKQNMERAFYYFNSRRQYPECILCFKGDYKGDISFGDK